MRQSRLSRGLVSLFALGVLVFAGYQLWRYFANGVESEPVYSNIIAQSMKVSGMVLRDELLLEATGLSGVPVYQVEDGVKVSRGMVLAEYYKNSDDAQSIRHLRDLEAKAELLQKAELSSQNTTAQADAYNKQILEQLSNVAGLVQTRSLTGLTQISDQLLVLMNTKQLTTGQLSGLSSAIAQLDAQKTYYSNRVSGEPEALTAEKAGYFIHAADGYENLTDLTTLSKISPEEVGSLMVQSPKSVENSVGKLMMSHNWYYIALVPMDSDDDFWVGREVTLDFHVEGARNVEAVITASNRDRKTEKTAVVFRSNYVNSATVNLRFTQADVNFKLMSGLWVPKQALRFQGFEQGVYTIQGDNMLFRTVNILYEDDYYVLCEEVPAADAQRYTSSLKQLDQVITKGAQLYDGKAL